MHHTSEYRLAEAPCLQLQIRMLSVPNSNGISIGSCEQSSIDAYKLLTLLCKLSFHLDELTDNPHGTYCIA